MTTTEQIARLAKNEDFKCWLDGIYEMREGTIGGMVDIGTDYLHQRIGAMAAYQGLLDMAGYDRRARPIDKTG